jgi:hypothetical protein
MQKKTVRHGVLMVEKRLSSAASPPQSGGLAAELNHFSTGKTPC